MNLNELIADKSSEEVLQIAGRIEVWAREIRRAILHKERDLEFASDLSEKTREEIAAKHDAVMAEKDVNPVASAVEVQL